MVGMQHVEIADALVLKCSAVNDLSSGDGDGGCVVLSSGGGRSGGATASLCGTGGSLRRPMLVSGIRRRGHSDSGHAGHALPPLLNSSRGVVRAERWEARRVRKVSENVQSLEE